MAISKKQSNSEGNAGGQTNTGLSGDPASTQTGSTGIGGQGSSQSTAGQSASSGQSSTGQSSLGQSTTGQSTTGGSTAGQSTTGQGTSGLAQMGTSSGGSSGSGAATATARSLIDQAKETAGQAYEVAAEKATTKLEEQKSTLSGGLTSIAGSVRQVSDNLRGPDVQDGISQFTAEYSELAAKKIEGIANYFEEKSVGEMYSDVEQFARRNPAVFVGGAFVIGLLAARFLKSGARTNTGGNGGSFQGRQNTGIGSQTEMSTV